MGRSLVLSLCLMAFAASPSFGVAVDGERYFAQLADGLEKVVLCNGNSAANATGIACGWIAFRDGRHVAAGRYSLMTGRKKDVPLGPGARLEVSVPPVISRLRKKTGEISLRICFWKASDEDGDDRVTIAESQFDFPRSVPAVGLPKCDSRVKWEESSDRIDFDCDGVGYAISKRTGMLCSARTGSWFRKEWLGSPMSPGLRGATNRLECVSVAFSTVRDMTNSVSLEVMSEWTGGVERLTVVQHWVVRGDGSLVVKTRFRDSAGLQSAGGYAFPLAVENPLVDYLAFGGKWGVLGFYGEEADGMTGERSGARSVSFDAGFDHLSFASCGEPFSFGISGGTLFVFPSPGVDRRPATLSLVVRPEKAGGAVTCNE